MTMRCRYHGFLRNGRPNSRNAARITVSCPHSTPALNDSSAGMNSERGRPISRQHAGESHPVQQTETEDDHRPPGVQLRREDVLDRDIDDR